MPSSWCLVPHVVLSVRSEQVQAGHLRALRGGLRRHERERPPGAHSKSELRHGAQPPQGLQLLCSLETLDVSRNRISVLAASWMPLTLTRVNLSHNQLHTLYGLEVPLQDSTR